jgi:hypothetical protein
MPDCRHVLWGFQIREICSRINTSEDIAERTAAGESISALITALKTPCSCPAAPRATNKAAVTKIQSSRTLERHATNPGRMECQWPGWSPGPEHRTAQSWQQAFPRQQFKVVIVGNLSVGKTSILISPVSRFSHRAPISIIGANFTTVSHSLGHADPPGVGDCGPRADNAVQPHPLRNPFR